MWLVFNILVINEIGNNKYVNVLFIFLLFINIYIYIVIKYFLK